MKKTNHNNNKPATVGSILKAHHKLNKRNLSIIILVVAATGGTIILATRAAGPFASIEPETSTIASPATTGTEANASNSSYVQFRAASQVTGWPDATNTGVPAGVNLSRFAPDNPIITSAGQIIDATDIYGRVQIRANNVTIKRSRINGSNNYQGVLLDYNGFGISNLILEDCEVTGYDPISPPALPINDSAVGWGKLTVRRCNIHHAVDGFKAGDDTLIEDSWIHDLYGNINGYHSDAVQSSGTEKLTIRHSVLEAPLMLGDEYGPLRNITVDNSKLLGGIWGGWNQSTGTRPQNMSITNCIISGPINYIAPEVVWVNNRRPDGTLIPHP